MASQVEAIDATLEARIRLQPALTRAHRFPRGATMTKLAAADAASHEGLKLLADDARALVRELLEIRAALLSGVPAVRTELGCSTERAARDALRVPKGPTDIAGLWSAVDASWCAAAPWRDSVLDRTGRTAALGLGGTAAKATKLRSLGASISSQVSAALADGVGSSWHLRVADVGRPLCEPLSKSPASQDALDYETFDDGELYASLLRDFLAAAAVRGRGPVDGIVSAPRKHTSREGVDRRASKARKLRFVIAHLEAVETAFRYPASPHHPTHHPNPPQSALQLRAAPQNHQFCGACSLRRPP